MSHADKETVAEVAADARRASVRAAREDEAALLTELTVRSKAHWGYDADFMRDALSDLTVTPEYVSANTVFVAESEGVVAGYYSLKRVGVDLELDNLFVEPRFISTGFGKLLWRHAIEEARRLGHGRMLIVSGPFAESFYLAMGALKIGERLSNIRPGRLLPLLKYVFANAPDHF